MKTRRVRSIYAPLLSENIKKEMNYRDYLKKRAVKGSKKNDHEAYKKQRNRVNKLVQTGKAQYYNEVLKNNKSNPKAMWIT